MGWAAVRNQAELPTILLYIGGVCWTLGYDTIYAHQDTVDDARLGVRSTALRLGANTKIFVAIMYAFAIICFMLASGNLLGVLGIVPAALHCAWQVYFLDIYTPKSAKEIFLSNSWLGLLVFLGLFFSKL
jgi:4-hydroxybenzoate polyprenyltransferase